MVPSNGRFSAPAINTRYKWQKRMSQNFLFVRKVAGMAGAEGRNSNILTQYLSCLAWDRAEILENRLKFVKDPSRPMKESQQGP